MTLRDVCHACSWEILQLGTLKRLQIIITCHRKNEVQKAGVISSQLAFRFMNFLFSSNDQKIVCHYASLSAKSCFISVSVTPVNQCIAFQLESICYHGFHSDSIPPVMNFHEHPVMNFNVKGL